MAEIVYWHWLAFGAVLLIVELLAPGMFFLWMAEGAIVTGGLLFAFPTLSFELQVGIFSVLSVSSIVIARVWVKRHPIDSDKPKLSRRMDELVVRVLVVQQAIINGEGRVKVGDSVWKARGEDCPIGSRVKVLASEGTVFIVEKLSDK